MIHPRRRPSGGFKPVAKLTQRSHHKRLYQSELGDLLAIMKTEMENHLRWPLSWRIERAQLSKILPPRQKMSLLTLHICWHFNQTCLYLAQFGLPIPKQFFYSFFLLFLFFFAHNFRERCVSFVQKISKQFV